MEASTGPLIINIFDDGKEKEETKDIVEQNAKGVYQFDDSVISVSVSTFDSM